jgi:hypothetical protein
MSDVNYVDNWEDEATQCKNCIVFQSKEGKSACVPEGKSFEEALEAYGEVSPNGHCDYFAKK